MSFVRPEAQALILRWREVLVGAAVLLLGVWMASGFGVLRWVGYGVFLIGALLIFTGVQRARFRTGKGGPGVVQVDEGEVMYYGPWWGGSVALRDVSRIELAGGGDTSVWRLHQPGQAALVIPTNAEGAEALFDAFATLPGMRTGAMLHALNNREGAADHPVVIWSSGAARLH
ncbi:hypothetical protein [Shimia aestuarii]|uniref:hypothetical protein n=1 Tax=Shimia aestuarii TaxID=254406 RepID=UPI001FB20435|nr:hypothetical protein [Shimia aestuarii]